MKILMFLALLPFAIAGLYYAGVIAVILLVAIAAFIRGIFGGRS